MQLEWNVGKPCGFHMAVRRLKAHYFALEYQTLNSNRVTIKEFLAVLYTRILFKTINSKGYDGEKILLGMSKVPVFWKKDIQCEMEKICKDVSVCGGAVTTEMMDEVFTTVVSDFDVKFNMGPYGDGMNVTVSKSISRSGFCLIFDAIVSSEKSVGVKDDDDEKKIVCDLFNHMIDREKDKSVRNR